MDPLIVVTCPPLRELQYSWIEFFNVTTIMMIFIEGEFFIVTTIMMTFIEGVWKEMGQRGLTLRENHHRKWLIRRKPLVW